MVTGMATRKVTITLDEFQLDQIRARVQARTAPSVSGFVQHAVTVALDDVAGWGAMLAEALRQTGGPLSDDERGAGPDDVLGARVASGLMPGMTMDAGGLIALDRDDRRVVVLLARARGKQEPVLRSRRPSWLRPSACRTPAGPALAVHPPAHDRRHRSRPGGCDQRRQAASRQRNI